MDEQRDAAAAGDGPLGRVEARLRQARLTASSPKGIVKVVYDGNGEGIGMELQPGAKQRFEAETMAGHVTAALQAADRALDALRQHAFGDETSAGQRPSASGDVARCFGRGD